MDTRLKNSAFNLCDCGYSLSLSSYLANFLTIYEDGSYKYETEEDLATAGVMRVGGYCRVVSP